LENSDFDLPFALKNTGVPSVLGDDRREINFYSEGRPPISCCSRYRRVSRNLLKLRDDPTPVRF
jgi:hypothetical protein